MCLYVHASVYVWAHAIAPMWRSEGNLQESVPSIYHRSWGTSSGHQEAPQQGPLPTDPSDGNLLIHVLLPEAWLWSSMKPML